MLMMNPSAKEFIPAHILKKRQEEADRLADDLVKVDINAKVRVTGQTESLSQPQNPNSENNSHVKGTDDERLRTESEHGASYDTKEAQIVNSELNNHHREKKDAKTNAGDETNQSNVENNHYRRADEYYSDDKYLLDAGEDICEFNGEQFIIPGDDEFLQPPDVAGYDFGNDEDNEDEDVCNAFEEFLENLPNQ